MCVDFRHEDGRAKGLHPSHKHAFLSIGFCLYGDSVSDPCRTLTVILVVLTLWSELYLVPLSCIPSIQETEGHKFPDNIVRRSSRGRGKGGEKKRGE